MGQKIKHSQQRKPNKFHEINMLDMTSGRPFFKGGYHKNHSDKRNRSDKEWKNEIHQDID